nr:serpin-ZX-like [Ipomoea batatas]
MDLRESIKNQVDVSLTLAKHVFSTEVKGDSNLVFSPLSINIILGLIAAGSKGPTLDQLLGFLKSKSTDDLNAFSSQIVAVIFSDGSPIGGPRLSVANGVWIDHTLPFKPSFKHVVDSVYKAVSESVDFQLKASEVANEVNLWAEKETGGLIKEILPPGAVDNTTRLVFANALYFKGAWTEKFDASDTTDQEFHLLNGSPVQVPFMSSKKKQYVKAFEGFKVLGLPYKQGEDKRHFSMYFFLPDARDGLPSLMDKLTSESGFLERHLPGHAVSVGEFRIPKFKISFGFEASRVLKELSVVSPFAGGLTEMVDSPVGNNLYVSQIFHKTFLEVNEEGTEAAAATGVTIKLRSLVVEEKVDFVADHPFIFFIREDLTGVVVFIGTLLNPLN